MWTMVNNLDKMIAASGMAKKDVAAAKGVTPETLSRHISGRISITRQDADDYARILGCLAQQIMFVTPPLPILNIVRPISGSKDPLQIIKDPAQKARAAYVPFYFAREHIVSLWELPLTYQGRYTEYRNALEILDSSNMHTGTVGAECVMHVCYAMADNGIIYRGMLYPEPGGTYTLHNADETAFETKKNLTLQWAIPVTGVVFRPELRGVEIV